MNRAGMSALAGLFVGIVIGFLLGGTGPRRELAAAEEEVAELESALAETEPRSGLRSPVPGLDQILQRRPEERARDAGVPVDGGVGLDEEDDDDPLTAFHRAASIQRVRRVQSRAALHQQADLDDEELAEIDSAVAEMNAELFGYGEELMLLAVENSTPPPGDLLGITHDVTGILHRAQLRLEDVLGTERVERVDDDATKIWNYVDLDQLEPAARAAVERMR